MLLFLGDLFFFWCFTRHLRQPPSDSFSFKDDCEWFPGIIQRKIEAIAQFFFGFSFFVVCGPPLCRGCLPSPTPTANTGSGEKTQLLAWMGHNWMVSLSGAACNTSRDVWQKLLWIDPGRNFGHGWGMGGKGWWHSMLFRDDLVLRR